MTQSMRRPTLPKRAAVLASFTLLAACALGPLQPDRNARAPKLDGYGQATLAAMTPSAAARELFAQGMTQAYAFNEVEAVRAFKAALAQDPECALCAWGVAWQLGPNINAPYRSEVQEALRYVDYALRHAQAATPREHALIEAMALRYAHASETKNTAPLMAQVCTAGKGGAGGADAYKADPLDVAYADRMLKLVQQYPDDPDVLSLYAEAEMIATPGEWWWDPAAGKPAGRIGELADRIEKLLPRHLEHTGLNHYMIHVVDDVHVAARAEAAADRLGALAPHSPHLLHMPSHTYANLGRYADATRVNQQAMAADKSFGAQLKQQGFAPSKNWNYHNGRFQWYGALMEGRGDVALQMARDIAKTGYFPDERNLPILTLVRLERWEAVLREPKPTEGDTGLNMVLDQSARGTALARLGRTAEAEATLAKVEPVAAELLAAERRIDWMSKMKAGMTEMARDRLRAEVALAQHRFDQALKDQAAAVVAGKDVDHNEPPSLGAGTRVALGDMQLKAQAWAEAEKTFRADLAEHPLSGWALRGLVASLKAQGRGTEARAQEMLLAKAWTAADGTLR